MREEPETLGSLLDAWVPGPVFVCFFFFIYFYFF